MATAAQHVRGREGLSGPRGGMPFEVGGVGGAELLPPSPLHPEQQVACCCHFPRTTEPGMCGCRLGFGALLGWECWLQATRGHAVLLSFSVLTCLEAEIPSAARFAGSEGAAVRTACLGLCGTAGASCLPLCLCHGCGCPPCDSGTTCGRPSAFSSSSYKTT